MNGRERFLAACARKPVDATPVWFMRQAGRYLPEYRELRKRHSILELAKTPALATEVALQPLRAMDVDAAILFADIVLPLEPMGVDLDLPDNVGPLIHRPVRTPRQVEELRTIDSAKDLGFVLDAVRALKQELGGEKALIGFSGAPFTLASYLIEGRPSRDFLETKRFMHGSPHAWRELMSKLADVVCDYLVHQVGAGADAVQLFDSWAGNLSPADYEAHVQPYTKRILDRLRPLRVPTIHFATPTAGLLTQVASAGGDVIGLDWRSSLLDARSALGGRVALQGNLDPATLATSGSATLSEADRILAEAGGRPGHIFNLGHGVLPSTPVHHVQRLVDHVHEATRKSLEVPA